MKMLSIIVPIYNKASYLNLCIDSILAQTFVDFELILINDGSTDASGLMCDYLRLKDKRVSVIHQENKGVHAARNAGLDVASGQYIGFVDSDDLLEPGMYELLMENAIKYNADISMCGVKRIFPHKTQLYGGKNKLRHYNRDEGVAGLLNGDILMSNYDKVYKKETVKHIRFEPALYEDTYYNFEALKAASLSVYDDRIMYDYMIRENSHSMAAFNQKYMNTLILTKKILRICELELPHLVEAAQAFDFNTNMIMLNMILTESRDHHSKDFEIILKNLEKYKDSFLNLQGIKKKYKYGYYLLTRSVNTYANLLDLYVLLTNSEHLGRKRKLATAPLTSIKL